MLDKISACYGLTKQGAQQRFRAARHQAKIITAAPEKKADAHGPDRVSDALPAQQYEVVLAGVAQLYLVGVGVPLQEIPGFRRFEVVREERPGLR